MSETEKITINLGLVDLGQIDLLVQEGFYSNRTDFIRTAIRNQLTTHAEEVRQTVARKTLVLGLQNSRPVRCWRKGCSAWRALTMT
jgi:Arc/MetJ-type ribon-helix-helix transcriptional regulator